MSKRKRGEESESIRTDCLVAVAKGLSHIDQNRQATFITVEALAEACRSFLPFFGSTDHHGGEGGGPDQNVSPAPVVATTTPAISPSPGTTPASSLSSSSNGATTADNDTIQPPSAKRSRSSSSKSKSKNEPTTRYKNAIHRCGALFLTGRYKGVHSSANDCSFNKDLYQFPFCICGWKLYEQAKEWSHTIAKHGIQTPAVAMADHMNKCKAAKKALEDLDKQLQYFSSDPHQALQNCHTLSCIGPEKLNPSEMALFTKVVQEKGHCICVGCWTQFADSMDLYVHMFKCGDRFATSIKLFALEITRSIYHTYYRNNGISFGDYLTSPDCAKFLNNFDDGTTMLLPFALPDLPLSNSGTVDVSIVPSTPASFNGDDDDNDEDDNDDDGLGDDLEEGEVIDKPDGDDSPVPPPPKPKTIILDGINGPKPANDASSSSMTFTKQPQSPQPPVGGTKVIPQKLSNGVPTMKPSITASNGLMKPMTINKSNSSLRALPSNSDFVNTTPATTKTVKFNNVKAPTPVNKNNVPSKKALIAEVPDDDDDVEDSQ